MLCKCVVKEILRDSHDPRDSRHPMHFLYGWVGVPPSVTPDHLEFGVCLSDSITQTYACGKMSCLAAVNTFIKSILALMSVLDEDSGAGLERGAFS